MQLHLGLLPLSDRNLGHLQVSWAHRDTGPCQQCNTELAGLHCLTHLGNHPVPTLQQPAKATTVQLEKLRAKQARQQQVTVTLGKEHGCSDTRKHKQREDDLSLSINYLLPIIPAFIRSCKHETPLCSRGFCSIRTQAHEQLRCQYPLMCKGLSSKGTHPHPAQEIVTS